MKPHKVSKELIGAVAEEQKHQAIDAAKKKAVAQHADYDTFKKMLRVSVAHLKPLHAPGGQGSKGCSLPAWLLDPGRLAAHSCSAVVDAASTAPSIDFGAQQQQRQGAVTAAQKSTQQQQHAHLIPAGSVPTAAAFGTSAHVLPRTSQEFAREWRRHCHTPADKYRLLKQCGPEGLAHMFRVEVDGLLLGQLLQAMHQQWKQQKTTQQHCQQQQDADTGTPTQQQQPELRSSSSSSQPAAPAAVEEEAAVAAEAVLVLRMLRSLTGAGRFDLSVRLLDKASKAAAADLCSQLQELLQQQDVRQQQQQQQQQQQEQVMATHSSTNRTGSNHSSSKDSTGSGQVSAGGDSSGSNMQVGNSSDISGQAGVGGDADSSGGAAAAALPQRDSVSGCASQRAEGGTVSAAQALADLKAVMAKLRL